MDDPQSEPPVDKVFLKRNAMYWKIMGRIVKRDESWPLGSRDYLVTSFISNMITSPLLRINVSKTSRARFHYCDFFQFHLVKLKTCHLPDDILSDHLSTIFRDKYISTIERPMMKLADLKKEECHDFRPLAGCKGLDCILERVVVLLGHHTFFINKNIPEVLVNRLKTLLINYGYLRTLLKPTCVRYETRHIRERSKKDQVKAKGKQVTS